MKNEEKTIWVVFRHYDRNLSFASATGVARPVTFRILECEDSLAFGFRSQLPLSEVQFSKEEAKSAYVGECERKANYLRAQLALAEEDLQKAMELET